MMLSNGKKQALVVVGVFVAGFLIGNFARISNINTVPSFETREEVFIQAETNNLDTNNLPSVPGNYKDEDFANFWKVWSILEEKYVPPPDSEDNSLDREDRINNAIKGLSFFVEDPYTSFLPPKDNKKFTDDVLKGEFGGVGIEVSVRGGALTIISPLIDSPAQKAGLKGKDVILEVDGVNILGVPISDSIELIRGEIGTEVELLIRRPEIAESFNVTVVRDLIKIPTLRTSTINEDIFVISLYNFSTKAPDEFLAALRTVKKENHKKIIFDLRNNPGGILDVAVYIASFFIEKNEPVLYKYSGGETVDAILSKGYKLLDTDEIEMVVIVNRSSASASEILAEALRHYGAATIIGEHSFGKGSVQELVNVGGGAALKITTAHWLPPSKKTIRKEGLIPDIEIDFSGEDIEIGDIETDPALQKAIEILNNK